MTTDRDLHLDAASRRAQYDTLPDSKTGQTSTSEGTETTGSTVIEVSQTSTSLAKTPPSTGYQGLPGETIQPATTKGHSESYPTQTTTAPNYQAGYQTQSKIEKSYQNQSTPVTSQGQGYQKQMSQGQTADHGYQGHGYSQQTDTKYQDPTDTTQSYQDYHDKKTSDQSYQGYQGQGEQPQVYHGQVYSGRSFIEQPMDDPYAYSGKSVDDQEGYQTKEHPEQDYEYQGNRYQDSYQGYAYGQDNGYTDPSNGAQAPEQTFYPESAPVCKYYINYFTLQANCEIPCSTGSS